MNITHAIHEEVTGDKLEAIFKRQSELMFKYHDIEKRSGLLRTEDCPVNLDDKRGQARIKDFAWGVTEEVGEALDAYRSRDDEHFHEELIDGLHFLTELSILAGITPKEIVQNLVDSIPTLPTDAAKDKDCLDSIYELAQIQIYLDGAITAFVESIGMMCNCLKNKPWKQSNMVTDKKAFYKRLSNLWSSYISVLAIANLSPEEVVDVYLKKSQVNKFRQRSNY